MSTNNTKLATIVQDLASSGPAKGAAMVRYFRNIAGFVARWVSDKLFETLSAADFGAAGDGEADDTDALLAFAAAINGTDTSPGKRGRIHKGTYLVTRGIHFQYCEVVGDGGGYYANARTTIRKTNGDANTTYVVSITGGSLKGVATHCASNQVYTQIAYNEDANSVNTGILVGTASTIEDCKAENFRTGIDQSGAVSTVKYCKVTTCNVGIYTGGTDSLVKDTYVNLCFTYGIQLAATLYRALGNRVEWCAHEGIYSNYGNGVISGNQLDRNGGPGVSLVGGIVYNVAITGNHFNRNGAGGDGTYGRWGFSTPSGGAESGYWDATVSGGKYSCHVHLDNPNGVTVSGNTFYKYGDDIGAGSISPRFNYYLNNVNSSTIGDNADNAGYAIDYGYHGGAGVLPAGSGRIALESGTNYVNNNYSTNVAESNKQTVTQFIPTGYAVEYPVVNLSTQAVDVRPGYVGYGYGSTVPFVAVRPYGGVGVSFASYQGTGAILNPYPSYTESHDGTFSHGDGSASPTQSFGAGAAIIYVYKDVAMFPDNTKSLGTFYARASVVYAGTGTINTSDEREKTFAEINELENIVAKELKGIIRKFQFNDSIAEKGTEKARYHFGVGAQTVVAIFAKHGLDATKYAMLCYDEWQEQPEIKDAEGNVTQEYKPAGNRYGIRYEELLAFIIGSM